MRTLIGVSIIVDLFIGYRFYNLAIKHHKLNVEFEKLIYEDVNRTANFINALYECEKQLKGDHNYQGYQDNKI